MRENFLVKILLTLNLLGMGFLLLSFIGGDSPTSDETPHLLSGYVALKYGQNYIDPEHPLLIKSLAATPLLFQDLEFNQTDPNYSNQKEDFDIGKMFKAAHTFLDYRSNDPDQIIFLARVPMILLTVFFGLVIFLFAQKLFNTKVALLATFLYSTEPNILAHGPLVNTDIAAAGFILTTIYALYLYSEKQTQKHLIFLILALTAALLSKFSTLYLVPIVLVLMEFIYHRQKNFQRAHMLYLIGGSLLIISLFYGLVSFRTEGWACFIPLQYFKGLVIVFAQVSASERFSWLLGESYNGARWYYFPILITVKTQTLTLVGFALALFFLWKKNLSLDLNQKVIFFSPLIIFLGLALVAKFNIGIRHVLPLYPFLIILAAASFIKLLDIILSVAKNLSIKTVLVSGVLLTVLIAGRLWSVGSTYPHFLSYYNFLVGGTDNGWMVANDSNYDWGQDVKRLAKYVSENNISSLAFDNYTGHYAASYYNIPVTNINPKDTGYKGYLALSTSVIAFYEDKEASYSWVTDNYQPIARAGKSIFIFELK